MMKLENFTYERHEEEEEGQDGKLVHCLNEKSNDNFFLHIGCMLEERDIVCFVLSRYLLLI